MTLTVADFDNGKIDLETVDAVANSKDPNTGAPADTWQTRRGDQTDTVQGRLSKLGVIFDDPIRDYAAGLLIEDLRAHRYPAGTGDIYIPKAPLPFTTGASFDADNWAVYNAKSANANPITFYSVDTMKAGTASNGDTLDQSHVLASDISAQTHGHEGGWAVLSEPVGGAKYILTTLQNVRDTKGDPTWEPDGFGDHYLFGGVQFVAMLDEERPTLAMFGAKDGAPSSNNIKAALSSGIPIKAQAGVTYYCEASIDLTDVAIDFDLNGSTIVNTAVSDRIINAYYPYSEIQSISVVNKASRFITVTDGTAYNVGDRVKIVSEDRCEGNRPAPGDGSNYWQSQTMTIESISVNTLTLREPFEEDYTFATSPKVMKYNQNTCSIYNGSVMSEVGFLGARTNGLIAIKGGTDHLLQVDIPLANNTALRFVGADGSTYRGRIGVVGLPTDSSGSHGVSLEAAINPKILDAIGTSCRHLFTNNDSPTQYADADYYSMGVTYDMLANNCTSHGDTSAPFSTHHGIRRGLFSNCIAKGGDAGFSLRGRSLRTENCISDGADTGCIAFSEDVMAEVDYTDDVDFSGVKIRDSVFQDVRSNRCKTVSISAIETKGLAKRAMTVIDTELFKMNGTNSFQSAGEFYNNGSYISLENSTVINYGTLNIDNENMSQLGTNRTMATSGAEDVNFRSYGKIVLQSQASYTMGNSTNGDFEIEELRMNFNSYPFSSIPSGAKTKFKSFSSTYTSGYIIATATAASDLSTRNATDETIAIRLISNTVGATLNTISDGQISGQRLLISITGSEDFTIATISNLDVKGTAIVAQPDESYRFFWNNSAWTIESRNP